MFECIISGSAHLMAQARSVFALTSRLYSLVSPDYICHEPPFYQRINCTNARSRVTGEIRLGTCLGAWPPELSSAHYHLKRQNRHSPPTHVKRFDGNAIYRRVMPNLHPRRFSCSQHPPSARSFRLDVIDIYIAFDRLDHQGKHRQRPHLHLTVIIKYWSEANLAVLESDPPSSE